MRTCPNCKTEYSDDKRFCKSCGVQLLSAKGGDPKFYAKKMVLEEKVKTDPLNVSLLMEYAQLLIDNMLYDEAILIIYKILAIDENNLNAQKLLFQLLKASGKPSEASEIGYKLIEVIPNDIDLLQDVSLLLLSEDDNTKALECFNRIIKIDPNSKNAWKNKAALLLKLKKEQEAFIAWDRVYNIDNTDFEARLYLGIEATRKSEYSKAKELLEPIMEKIEDKTYNFFLGLVFLANAYINLNQNEKTIADLYAKTMDCANPDWFDDEVNLLLIEIALFLGQKELHKGNFNEALLYFENIGEFGNIEKCNELCAVTYYKMGEEFYIKKDFENAEYYLGEIAKLDGTNSEMMEKYSEMTTQIKYAKKKKKKSFFTKVIVFTIAIIVVIISVMLFKNYAHAYNEENAWIEAEKNNTSSSFQTYLSEYPDGKYLKAAIIAKENALWKETENSPSLESYQKYISQYPDGRYKEKALSKILVISRGQNVLILQEAKIYGEDGKEIDVTRRLRESIINDHLRIVNNAASITVKYIYNGSAHVKTVWQGETLVLPETISSNSQGTEAVINDSDGYTNIRSGPGTQYEIVSKIVDNEIFYIVSKQENWCKVKTREGKYGYIHSSRIRLKN